MSGRFILPPVIRRFGRFGDLEERKPLSPGLGESSQSSGELHRNEPTYPLCYRGAETRTERVKSFMNGIVSPLTTCLRPSDGSCVPGCAPDRIFLKQPAVVSPHLDRVITYRDSRAEQDEYSRYPHSRHKTANNYHSSRHLSNSSQVVTPSATLSSRRDPATVELESVSNSAVRGTNTIAYDKKKRSTGIAKPCSNDILCGRGGSSNRHLGNIHFRELVAANKQIYVGLTKKQKMLVARKIVDAIHNTGGRFLAKDLDTGFFYDIGLPRSLEKTSQALREKHSNEMPVQPVEDEGIEISVESHHSVMKKNVSTDESERVAGDSSDVASFSSKITTKSLKNTEAPSLIIPSHLTKIFGQKGSSVYEEDSENNHQHALSPRRHYNTEQPYDSHHSPYPPSPHSQHNQQDYQPLTGHLTAQPGRHHHHHPPYPASSVPSSNQYLSHPHYYYRGRPPQTPPYSRRSRGHDERYAYPAHDDRDVYSNEFYSRSTGYEQAVPRLPSHRMPPPALHNRFPGHLPSSRNHEHPVPHVSPHSSSQGAPRPSSSSFGSHAPLMPLPPYQPSQQSPHNYYPYKSNGSPPSLPLPRETSPSSRIIYRTINSSYVRCNSDVSPARQRELKRQRNGDGHTTRTSDASLSSAVKHSLSLDERAVGREREKQQPLQERNSTGDNTNSSRRLELISPSTILQSKSCSRMNMMVESSSVGSPSEKKEDYSALSGLAALSTAAFLKLDEDNV